MHFKKDIHDNAGDVRRLLMKTAFVLTSMINGQAVPRKPPVRKIVALKVALKYYRCRTKHGKKGTCKSSVLGYRCSERRNSIPTEINARVTCRHGKATVVHTYQQNT